MLDSLLIKLKNMNIGSIINGTNNTLKTIKKAIPVYKEVRPYIRREKKLFNKEELFNKNNDDGNIIKKESNNDTLTFFN